MDRLIQASALANWARTRVEAAGRADANMTSVASVEADVELL
jgi:hypothetical protein